MTSERTTLLLVDDDPNNIEILESYLEEADYDCVSASQGKEAMALLQESPDRFQVILLDRMMPEMDGMDCLGQIKSHPELAHLPIIMQTAAAESKKIQEGIDAGVFYYLTKPFTEEVLLSVVHSAVRDFQRYQDLQSQVDQSSDIFLHLQSAEFKIQTLDQAQTLAANLSKAFPDPYQAVGGLIELLINAIEHGNLNISYTEKTQLLESNEWEAEVARRLQQPEHVHKQVYLKIHKHADVIEVIIRDEGPGFDWRLHLDAGMDVGLANHGRGIAMAKGISFDTLEYVGSGNEVRGTVKLHPASDYATEEDALSGIKRTLVGK